MAVEASVDEPDQMVIRISDTGTGIDPGIMEKLFDPFFTTKPVGKGSGLGLSISLGIVQHHGGQLTLENNDRGGATAIVRLPLQPAEAHSRE